MHEIRGLLKIFGVKLPIRLSRGAYDVAVRDSIENDPALSHALLPMLQARQMLFETFMELDRRVRKAEDARETTNDGSKGRHQYCCFQSGTVILMMSQLRQNLKLSIDDELMLEGPSRACLCAPPRPYNPLQSAAHARPALAAKMRVN